MAMGSFDGAQCCELVGLYMLSCLQHLNMNVGLYRDDALGVLDGTRRQNELTKKEICRVFKENNLSITIEVNSKNVNFLDIEMNLDSGLFKPYRKENDIPVYIHSQSNHPPSIIKSIPAAVNRRLSSISANEGVFTEATSGYHEWVPAQAQICHFNQPKQWKTK